MTKKYDEELDAIIDRFHITEKCDLTREQIHLRVKKGMVCISLAHVLADAANTLLKDAEFYLNPLEVSFERQDKQNYKRMLKAMAAAKKTAAECAFQVYQTNDVDYFAFDSDWWYQVILLINDRVGENKRKTNIVLEWLLNMPSEINLFNNIKKNDFEHPDYDTATET